MMALRARIQPISRDIDLMLNQDLSPQAQSKAFAEYAHDQIGEAKQTNRTVLGRVPYHTVTVDGRAGAPLESVRPDGVIVAEFDIVPDVLGWIGEHLVRHSPVGKTGNYQRSHTLYADGIEINLGAVIPRATEYVFLNSVPYARKIELGSSSQAPDGVYQVVAVLARRRFGNIARIGFNYRTALSGSIVGGARGNRSSTRMPAIVVTLGDR